jgi:hypothetical protein
LKGKIGLPDFDPSHIITVAALLEGGDEATWQKGQERLKRLKPNIAAFYATDARSQDLMKTGEAPVQGDAPPATPITSSGRACRSRSSILRTKPGSWGSIAGP